jgi:small-conductance mechanosensitive channel
MDSLLDLLADNDSATGRLVTTAAIVLVAMVVAWGATLVVGRRIDDVYTRYYVAKAIRYVTFFVALIAIAVVWRAFAGRAGIVLGLAAAGLAFAMQEVVGAVAGWFNVLSGRIYRVGDRIQMAGVQGDVIDITPLRTKLLEIGSESDQKTWVKGRQFTGRVVSVSNKATFTEPLYNYSAAFEYIWEELMFPISERSDWREAERIMQEEVARISNSEGARQAVETMARRYPMPRTELEPRVFVRATDNWMELAARFVVPVRTARSVKDQLTRHISERFDQAGIEIASETQEITVVIDDDAD